MHEIEGDLIKYFYKFNEADDAAVRHPHHHQQLLLLLLPGAVL